MPEGTPRMARRQEHADQPESVGEDKPADVIQLEGYQHSSPQEPRGAWNRSKAK